MMAGLLLDGLLLLVVALYIPIGALRGGPREALLAGSILLGAATADALAPAWGDALAGAAGIEEPTSRFLVAVALLLAIGLGLGFGAGAFAGRAVPTLESRIAGGAIGCVNALLLLSFAVSSLNDFLHGGRTNRTVAAGWFAENLAEERGWLLGFATVLAAGLVAAYRLTARFDDDLARPSIPLAADDATTPRRRLAVAPPADPDGGKVEPTPDAPGWASLNAEAGLRPLNVAPRPVDPTEIGPEWLAVGGPPSSGPGHGRGGRPSGAPGGASNGGSRSVVDEWLRRAAEHSGSSSGGAEAEAGDQPATRDQPPGAFTDAALRNLLDPPARLEQTPLPRVDPHFGLIPDVDPDPDDSFASASRPAPGAGALDPIRRCPVCGTPAVTDLLTCPFCGGDL